MKINHRMTTSPGSDFYRAIKALGFEFDDSEYISVLNITEDHEKWPRVKELMHEFDISAMVENKFDKNEILDAEWLQIGATGHFGYPQPEDNYQEITYDENRICPSCGIGKVQKAPFRFRSEPKASRSQFLQLNWIFDEFFVRPDVKEAFTNNNISGIIYENPVINKSNAPISSIYQLKIKNTQNPCLITTNLEPVTCKLNNEEFSPSMEKFMGKKDTFCGNVKYHFGKRGPFQFQRNSFLCNDDVMKSFEWFGSGFQAFRMVIISRKVSDIIIKNKWRGIYMHPIHLIS
jgi:hypothetical protein